MEFVKTNSAEEGIKKMAEEIAGGLAGKKKVVWLICGGSNVPLAAEAMKLIREKTPVERMKNLAVMQTDERFGPVGHKDSNWKQMIDAEFDFGGVKSVPMLIGADIKKTVANYAKIVAREFKRADLIVAQFGIGVDGHIAGILPKSLAVSSEDIAFIYDAPPFVRMTLTPPTLRQIHSAYAFVLGDPKKEQAIARLAEKTRPIFEEPCQILKEIPRAILYSDVLL